MVCMRYRLVTSSRCGLPPSVCASAAMKATRNAVSDVQAIVQRTPRPASPIRTSSGTRTATLILVLIRLSEWQYNVRSKLDTGSFLAIIGDREPDSSALLRVCRRERKQDRRKVEGRTGKGACRVSSSARSLVEGSEADPIALNNNGKCHG